MTSIARKQESSTSRSLRSCLPLVVLFLCSGFVNSTFSQEPVRRGAQAGSHKAGAVKSTQVAKNTPIKKNFAPRAQTSSPRSAQTTRGAMASQRQASNQIRPAQYETPDAIQSSQPESAQALSSDPEFFGEAEVSEWFPDEGSHSDFADYSHFHPTVMPPGCGIFNRHSVWVRPEFGLWWLKGYSVPALVTTSPLGTDQTLVGRLDQLGTTTLYGGDRISDTLRTGGRIRFGLWCDPCSMHGIDVSYMGLASGDDKFSASSDTTPILARPFYNVEPNLVGPDAELVAYPQILSGNINIQNQTSFEVIEVLYRHRSPRTRSESLDFLLGWRFSRLDDRLSIQDFKTSLDPGSGIAIGTTILEQDHFIARNRFNGVELGLIKDGYCGCWSWELMGKMALGRARSRTNITGQTVVTVPVVGGVDDVNVTPTGLLAQQTNIRTIDTNSFAVIPEARLGLGCLITDRLQATLGYTFMYWPGVERAGLLIDPRLNLSQLAPGGLTGPARPTNVSGSSSVWAQGINFGFNYQF